MTVEELRRLVTDEAAISQRPFEILRELSTLLNSGQEDACRELVLFALERRAMFNGHHGILDALIRELGLFPYLEQDELSLPDLLAYEYHRPLNYDEPIVFHREQALVYRRLLAGDNVILSAPTSFGKSKVIDAIIASRKHRHIVVIVPTLALIDETRRRLARFSGHYKIVTQVSQEPAERNLFIFTAERLNAYEGLPSVEFFVIDEFYKIGALSEDQKRTVALNQAFYRLSKKGAQFYLLGPCVNEIPSGFEARFECRFIKTTFATVAAEEIRVSQRGEDVAALCDLMQSLRGEPTLIFCKSPARVSEVCRALLKAGVGADVPSMDAAAQWMERNFHPDWTLPHALRRGIGMHHGRLPRSLGQFVVRAFNSDQLQVLACTSTLIEGVNTKAKNVVVFDNRIARDKFDYFTFNNIKGRSGRMFHHFVGRVFLFHEPPADPLPFVDFPVFTQGDDAPESILVHLEDKDLSSESKARLEPILQQNEIPLELLRRHSSIEPIDLISLAKHLKTLTVSERASLAWTGSPNGDQFRLACSLIWKHFVSRSRGGVFSSAQLARNVWNLKFHPSVKERVRAELVPGDWAAASADEAVERVLDFDRTWASFELPRMLRALSDVRKHVLDGPGDYTFFASQIENLFRSPYQLALEEFGLPLQMLDKIGSSLAGVQNLEEALNRIKTLPVARYNLDAMEQDLLRDCQSTI